MNIIDKLAWLQIKDNQLLVARSKGKNTFYVPGGKREVGESDHDALIREIKEELSVDLVPATIKYVKTFLEDAHDKPAGVKVKMTCYYADFTGDIKANAEIEDACWLYYKDKEKSSPVTQIIMDWLKSEGELT